MFTAPCLSIGYFNVYLPVRTGLASPQHMSSTSQCTVLFIYSSLLFSLVSVYHLYYTGALSYLPLPSTFTVLVYYPFLLLATLNASRLTLVLPSVLGSLDLRFVTLYMCLSVILIPFAGSAVASPASVVQLKINCLLPCRPVYQEQMHDLDLDSWFIFNLHRKPFF
jgi:hypothetical protein